jgi:hypothetical protein
MKVNQYVDITEVLLRLIFDALTIGMFSQSLDPFTPGSLGDQFLHETELWKQEFILRQRFDIFRKFSRDPTIQRAYEANKFLVCIIILHTYIHT